MLAEASDWPFIMTTGTVEEYARKRVRTHLERFHQLCAMLKEPGANRAQLTELEAADPIFPEFDYRIYRD
jgi:1,4-alpha-glucan branching enzyme